MKKLNIILACLLVVMASVVVVVLLLPVQVTVSYESLEEYQEYENYYEEIPLSWSLLRDETDQIEMWWSYPELNPDISYGGVKTMKTVDIKNVDQEGGIFLVWVQLTSGENVIDSSYIQSGENITFRFSDVSPSIYGPYVEPPTKQVQQTRTVTKTRIVNKNEVVIKRVYELLLGG